MKLYSMKNTLFISLLLFTFFTDAQTTSYQDVAVIINDNSQNSIDIGNYFQTARNIPDENMIHVFAPTNENIDSVSFEQLRAQIENHLINTNSVNSINYLVTTKGVPLKINSGCILDNIPGSTCASVDSELSLILGTYSNHIGQSGSFLNPFFNTTSNFSRDSVEMYLVTRLDGYTTEDVFNLIDNSGPSTGINKLSAKAVVDISNFGASDLSPFISKFTPAYNFLVNNSWNSEIDTNFNPLVNQDNVFSYLGIGHGPLPNTNINYNWTEGAFGIMEMCNSAFTFNQTTNSNNAFVVADLIANGCTGAIGHVDYIFMSQIMDAEIFLARYLDENHNYNLAESFYMADQFSSWQTVIIGDPKASLIIDNTAQVVEDFIQSINIYPNPGKDIINIVGNELITSISLYDINGRLVKKHNQINTYSTKLNLNDLTKGIYVIEVQFREKLTREKILLE